jgi:hypothetical protein
VTVAEGEDVFRLGKLGGRHEEALDPSLSGMIEGLLPLVLGQALHVAVGVNETGEVPSGRAHFTCIPAESCLSGRVQEDRLALEGSG